MIMNNKIKKSQLIFDMKLVRKLLKMNGEVRFCPFCGKEREEMPSAGDLPPNILKARGY